MKSVRDRLAVVVVTRDRRDELRRSLTQVVSLPEEPAIVVVDNGSSDGTADMVREEFPDVRVIALAHNLGAAGRTVAAKSLDTPLIAFADDDSWWAPGALAKAVEVFDAYPRLALLNGAILVGADERLDPTCAAMAASPLHEPDLPGPALLGFVACGTVVRRNAFLSVGGFQAGFDVGGEEELVALDLMAAGWGLAYVPEVVAHHHASTVRTPVDRRRRELRNAVYVALLRLPARVVAARAVACLVRVTSPAGRGALREALTALPWALANRRQLPRHVYEARARL